LKSAKPALIISLVYALACSERVQSSGESSILHLIKTGEIVGASSEKGMAKFGNIDSFCFNQEGDLYVADSGRNIIYKLNPEGKLIRFFGREGQGPGELLGRPGFRPLRISCGNDANLYVVDTGNGRISVFTGEGKFLRHFYVRNSDLTGPATVSSNGDIYLIANNKDNIIYRYDQNLKLKEGFLNNRFHFHYPFYEEPHSELRYISDRTLIKMITKENHHVLFSNISLTAFVFDEDSSLMNSFETNPAPFVGQFKKELKKAVAKGSFIAPFLASLDGEENLCLLYRKRVYRYSLQGTLLDAVDLPDVMQGRIKAYQIDRSGRYFFVRDDESFEIYKIQK
jgi:sugar lactone lactonase YvrE